jgi:hypothetical protein
MLSPALEEKLRRARLALDEATSDDIIERCKQYLALLALYRAELYSLPDTLELDPRSASSQMRETIGGARKAVRAAIERTTQERNQTETLLLSFTAVSGYEAAETLNKVKYKGQDTWELRAGGVGCVGSPGNRMSVQEAVETASLLRREAHIAKTATRAAADIRSISNSEPDGAHEGSTL